jgi:hypothetical protein
MSSEPRNPTFDIQLATLTRDSRILVNGEDVSRCIKSVKVEQIAGQPAIVTLELIAGTHISLKADAILRLIDLAKSQPPLETRLPEGSYGT